MDLYIETYSGIAGDMMIGALLDLGADRKKLEDGIKSLNLKGYEMTFKDTKKNGIRAYDFDVKLEGLAHHHDHSHKDEVNHHHDHESDGEDHDHHHDHPGHHVHRNLKDIEEIINSGDLSDWVKENSLAIFDIIADSESQAHGIEKDQVHFHEVGGEDTIIDIVGTCILLENLGVENIYFSDLFDGRGFQNCAHGPMPVPVPAVLNIIKTYDILLNILEEEGEHTTPTGAAIYAHFRQDEELQDFKVKKIGLGAGNRDFKKTTNILRVMEIEKPKKKD